MLLYLVKVIFLYEKIFYYHFAQKQVVPPKEGEIYAWRQFDECTKFGSNLPLLLISIESHHLLIEYDRRHIISNICIPAIKVCIPCLLLKGFKLYIASKKY
ncbi:hypothetical protein PHYBLDRAFT_167753 [Phycomyces blakesleeanus NRRL 1555(-)]|uniref:Uncharacterized protein n=1 Tax=Phycomyces blakesleeanus (strain ATCC 8743b / DSM 1359 / FGSC 10004 / NBRC 33097 / NRRL 1555) TaxID=763407 RepID=A0A167MWY4_PHYB8|nr:hypothetical protein PHYBLDRAFT_167753 [Phycomyces blakesleeanus NRRL 1555(-)]OAD74339.1 hypothetical protein PHYBLDRAFT_167753 [Phycomyces blakesleeanus NRRL 1555(-)]|eukprot:XP_018292379.1 hypothetical protein PHYBLDRAFT_167753 [Phycomyces blakesleeanus NRRL 1555(-)]